MTLSKPRKTSWATSTHWCWGGSSSRGADHCSASSSHAPLNVGDASQAPINAEGACHAPINPEGGGFARQTDQVTVVVTPDPIPVLVLQQSSMTPTEMVVPLERKRKTKEGEKSSYKRSRREFCYSSCLNQIFISFYSISKNVVLLAFK